MARTVLIVEDEADLVEVIRYNLEREGMSVQAVGSGEEGIAQAHALRPDLILLDIMLPGRNGLEVCREVRAAPNTRQIPIIILSARGEEADIVAGLELGADDYVTKPFSPRVLIARIRAVLRRQAATAPLEAGGDPVVKVGDLTLDRARYEAHVHNRPLVLTKTEFELLDFMARRRGRVFTRSQLLDAVQGEEAVVTDRTVDVHIAALRKKLGDHTTMIDTVRGIGYRFAEME